MNSYKTYIYLGLIAVHLFRFGSLIIELWVYIQRAGYVFPARWYYKCL